MKLNGFSSGSDSSESTPSIFLSARKLKFLEALQCELGFSQVVFSISSRRVEISVNGCKNQSKEIHVLFVISEP